MDNEMRGEIARIIASENEIWDGEKMAFPYGQYADQILAAETATHRIAVIKKGEPPELSADDCHTIDHPYDYNIGAGEQRDSDIEYYKGE